MTIVPEPPTPPDVARETDAKEVDVPEQPPTGGDTDTPAVVEEPLPEACTQGRASACYKEATKLAARRATRKTAMSALEIACDGGVNRACMDLGVIYIGGLWVPHSSGDAYRYLRKACFGPPYTPDDSVSPCTLIPDVAKDPLKAAEALQRGCDVWRDESACGSLGIAYADNAKGYEI